MEITERQIRRIARQEFDMLTKSSRYTRIGGIGGVGDVTWAMLSDNEDTHQIAHSHLTTALQNYVTSSALQTTLADYVTSSALSTTLADYVTSTALSTTLADYATKTYVDQNYLSLSFFNALFQARTSQGVAVVPNGGDTSTIDNIKAMFGFWTEQYLSALGQGSGGGGGGGASALYECNDVTKDPNADKVSGATTNTVLTYGSDGKWYAAAIPDQSWSTITNKPTEFAPSYGSNYYMQIKNDAGCNGKNFNIADEGGAAGIYYVNKDSYTGQTNAADNNYGMVVDFNTHAAHLQFNVNNEFNEIYVRSYWWTARSGGITYPAWQQLIHSGNIGNQSVNYATSAGSAASASSATKATQDGDGNTISSTYLKLSGGDMAGKITFTQASDKRDRGIIGTYDADRAAAIWSMGASYQIAADGLTFGNLYGAAYAYFGAGHTFGDGYSSGHSFVWCQNGTVTAALGNYIWSSGGFKKNNSSDLYALLGGGGHKAISDFLLKEGGTMTGILTLLGSQYDGYNTGTNRTYALNANNSDIVGVNSILTSDKSDSWAESIGFARDDNAGHYDTFRAANGTFYFGFNGYFDSSNTEHAASEIITMKSTGSIECVRADSSDSRMLVNNSLGNSVMLLASTNRGLYLENKGWIIASDGTNCWSAFGNFGIGTNSPQYKLHVAGDVYAEGGISTLSDIRKKNVTDMVLPLNLVEIANAPTIKFTWKNNHEEGVQVGTIAQYWASVLPEVVKNRNGVLAMQYDVTALACAIVDAREIVALKREVNELKKELKRLKSA